MGLYDRTVDQSMNIMDCGMTISSSVRWALNIISIPNTKGAVEYKEEEGAVLRGSTIDVFANFEVGVI